MMHRLVYVIGPSGAGKDSVLDGLRRSWPAREPAHWARRTITRPAQAGSEQHEAVTTDSFEQLRLAQAFAMHWGANGLHYGIRHTEIEPARSGHCVFVNGSRAWLPQLLLHWPQATVVHIGAAHDVLVQRLASRGRESADAIAARLARQVPLKLPEASIRIENNGRLEDTVATLLNALQKLNPPVFPPH